MSTAIKYNINDKKVFKHLFNNYYRSLYVYACKFVDDDIAHDCVQDLFTSIWHNTPHFETDYSLNRYLFKGVRNNCFHWLEKQKVRNRYLNDSQINLALNEISYYDNIPEGMASLLEKEMIEEVEKAITKLPAMCQKVFRMSRIEYKKNKEIAEELNISQKTVEKHLTKALKVLTKELKEYLPIIMFSLGIDKILL